MALPRKPCDSPILMLIKAGSWANPLVLSGFPLIFVSLPYDFLGGRIPLQFPVSWLSCQTARFSTGNGENVPFLCPFPQFNPLPGDLHSL
ncbi:conserved domain protein [delta proteobacterium NaphS2]|nr:conserved domain protein [delta proteobacterium NaphS2]